MRLSIGILAAASLLAGRLDAQGTANPHGDGVAACATCHLPTGWTPVRIAPSFRHAERTFPLEGAHATATCVSCHASLVFSEAATSCASCHEDVHRGELGQTCSRCHTSRDFTDQTRLARLHEETRFPLRGAHVTTRCESCHARTTAGQPQFTSQPTGCVGCHQPDYQAALEPPHASAGFPTDCASCHTETTWRGAPFDHAATNFPLTGAHQAATCASCHADGSYAGTPSTCEACHRGDYDRTTAPPHAAAAFATTCSSCHATTAWLGAPFDHQATQFPLTGAHLATTCAACHADGVYRGKPTTCVACHQDDFNATSSPPHAAAGYGTDCTTCHTGTTTWSGAVFDHQATQFPLAGAHLAATCQDCHADGVYRGKPTTCISCHQPDYDGTTSPAHAAAGYGTDCTTCHTGTSSWQGAAFDHQATQFPLAGAHLAATCQDCHADGVYRGKPTTCISCHQPDYDGTTSPAHAAAGYGTDCTTCHTGTSSWQGAVFDHQATQFPLAGAHLAATCQDCHADGVYRGKPTACISCHQPDYDGTANPSHAAAGYGTDCTTCHTGTSSWQGAVFDHQATQFPLAGAHLVATCQDCHADGVYRGKPTACISCHQPDYDGTTNPSHAAAGYGTDCTTCHTGTSTWQGAVFDHQATQFPLAGAHLAATCQGCHADGVYRGKPTACISCHQPDYAGTTNPPHAAAGYGTDCTTCHTGTSTWQGAVFDHQATQFPLLGAHLAASCQDCHADGVYAGKPTACISCHQPDYAGTTNPPHAAAGFPTDCTACHGSASWQGATFNHAATAFPLTGAHVAASCASCHADGVYAGKPTTCVSCHQSDYTGATNPNHQAAGFPATCESCHTTTTWNGATFDHDSQWFPIYSGAHRNRWGSCTECHTVPTDFSVFTCLTCHRQGETDSHHRQVNGYQYQSQACLSCHPRGRS